MGCVAKSLVVIVCALQCQFSVGQLFYLDQDQSALNSKLYENLQGEWFLSETEFVDGYGFERDSNRFVSSYAESRKIVFKGDSVHAHPVQGKPYYTGYVRSYQFKIEYDTVLNINSIELYEGRKRKCELVETYEVLKCDPNELVLKSYKWLREGLDLCRLSVFYTYRREGVDSLLARLSGEWTNCSKEKQPFFYDADGSELTLARASKPVSCNESDDHFISLNFLRNRQKNLCRYFGYKGVIGGGAEFTVEVDPLNQLIYFGYTNVNVYNIITLTENELVLSFNRERTEALKLNSE